jgi:hypothetical protein
MTLVAIAALLASRASACSVCRCGESMMLCSADTSDHSAHLLNGLPDRGQFRLQLATAVSSKTSDIAGGIAAEVLGSEHQREYRPSLRATFGIWNSLSVSAELPFSYKRNTEVSSDETKLTTSSGFSDAEIGLAWSTPLSHASDATWLIGLSATSKLPTGSNDLKDGDERADEHLQPGTGSYDFQIGGALSALNPGMTVHGSVYYRYNGKNDYGYQYGRAVLYNVGVQHRISGFLFGTIQMNGRHAAQDIENGDKVEHTGGTVIYAAPGLRYGLTPRVSLTTNLQIPMYQKLYGVQSEKVVLNSGFSFEI